MEIIRRKELKAKPAPGTPLGFGKFFTDHMFTMRYEEGKGWHDPTVRPYEPFSLDPATSVLHYAQGVFEGMKAFLQPDGSIAVFRPEENWARLNRSCERMCIPPLPVEKLREGLDVLLKLDEDWIPSATGTALYIRPTVIATRVMLGVHASTEYLFFIILSPVGSYYENGLTPVSLLAEEKFVRSAVGGTGEAKCLGNYAASILAGELAAKKGYDQVLWLDAAEKKYVEEVGSMNIFFVLGDEVVTPALTGSILPGITRKTVLQLLEERKIPHAERRISVEELVEANRTGLLREAFGTGTAAVISPVGRINCHGTDLVVGDGRMGRITETLYRIITQIQRGRLPDHHGWLHHVN